MTATAVPTFESSTARPEPFPESNAWSGRAGEARGPRHSSPGDWLRGLRQCLSGPVHVCGGHQVRVDSALSGVDGPRPGFDDGARTGPIPGSSNRRACGCPSAPPPSFLHRTPTRADARAAAQGSIARIVCRSFPSRPRGRPFPSDLGFSPWRVWYCCCRRASRTA